MQMRLLFHAIPGTSYTHSLRKLHRRRSASARRRLHDALLSLTATSVLHPASSQIPSSFAKLPPAENTRDKHKTTELVAAA
jgi:hypothetical protein